MIQIKRNLKFALEKRKKNGELIIENVPILLRVTYNGARVNIYTGYRINFCSWNEEKQEVRHQSSNKHNQSASFINSRILELKVALQDHFAKSETADIIPKKEELRELVNEFKLKGKTKIQNKTEDSFFDIFELFVKENSRLNNWTKATISKFSTIKRHLQNFKKDLSFNDLNQEGLNDFIVHLSKNAKMRNTTIKKQLGFFKWFIRWAYEKKYHQNDAYKSFRPKLKTSKKPVIFLSQEEIQKIKDLKIPKTKQYLERVRDVLIFMCYTGLRHSDVYNLKRSDIKSDHIQITTIKTFDNLTIELNDHSKAVLKKYSEIPYKNDKALPVISNQTMNDYIKELGELAEINTIVRFTYYILNERIDEYYPKHEVLSTHVGRRTFICSALSLGIPVQVVMKWTGHSDYRSMKPYIDVADNIKKTAMQKFNL